VSIKRTHQSTVIDWWDYMEQVLNDSFLLSFDTGFTWVPKFFRSYSVD